MKNFAMVLVLVLVLAPGASSQPDTTCQSAEAMLYASEGKAIHLYWLRRAEAGHTEEQVVDGRLKAIPPEHHREWIRRYEVIRGALQEGKLPC